MTNQNRSAEAKMTGSIIAIIVLSICLFFTSAALMWPEVTIDGNTFMMGKVEIDLNGGTPIIEEHEFIFEPGATVKKDFYVQNNSTGDVYYKLYFKNVTGNLSDILEVKIFDGDKILYEGTPATLLYADVRAANDILAVDEKRELEISFYFPKDSGNEYQAQYLRFDFVVEATQAKNNPNKEF